MAAATKRVTAWRSREEWGAVYSELFSACDADRRHALQCVAVWKSRALHKLSLGVQCTWELVSAQLKDEEFQSNGLLQEKDQELRMMYSVAVIRFVNILTEKGQKGLFAQPVHRLAESLGLPDWMVELRHEATHAHLPTLPVLRTAATFALSWLKQEYWELQTDADLESGSQSPGKAIYKKNFTRERIYEAVIHFKKLREKTVTPEANRDYRREWHEQYELLQDIFFNVCCRTKNREVLLDILLEKGNLLPFEKELQDMKDSTEPNSTTSNKLLPQSTIDYWTPLLSKLHDNQRFLPELLNKLCDVMTEEGSDSDIVVLNWISALITANYIAMHLDDSKNFLRKGHKIDLEPVIKRCVKCPNKGTAQFLQSLSHILEDLNIYHTSQTTQLAKLAQLYTSQQAGDQRANNEEGVKTVEALRQLHTTDEIISEETGHRQDDVMDTSEELSWLLAPDHIDWSQIAICGSLTDTQTSYDLELPEEVNQLGITNSVGAPIVSIEYDNHRKSRPDIKPVTEWAEGIKADSALLQFDLNEYVYQVCNWGWDHVIERGGKGENRHQDVVTAVSSPDQEAQISNIRLL